jgi:hypothetical protein
MMRRFALLFAIVLPLALTASDDAPRKWPRIRLGGIVVGAGYTRYGGGYPSFYSPYWYGGPWINAAWMSPWAPYWYGPYFHPGFFTGYGYEPNMGEVKLRAERGSEVFLNDGFAGNAGKLRSMWLEPGVYNLEVRSSDGSSYKRRIYVLSGKALTVQAQLGPATGPQKERP